MEAEPTKPKKESSDRRFDDNEGFVSSGPHCHVLRISADEYAKPVIESMQWHIPQGGVKVFWNVHQSGSSALFACVANMSPKGEVAELGCTVNYFLEKSLKRLGAKGRISTAEPTAYLPPSNYAFKVQRGLEKKTKEMKALSLNGNEWFWHNGCVMLEMRQYKSFTTLLRKTLVYFQVNYAKDVFGAKALIVRSKTRHKQSDNDKFQHQKRIHYRYIPSEFFGLILADGADRTAPTLTFRALGSVNGTFLGSVSRPHKCASKALA